MASSTEASYQGRALAAVVAVAEAVELRWIAENLAAIAGPLQAKTNLLGGNLAGIASRTGRRVPMDRC